MIPVSQPLIWNPKGCSDAKDSRSAFKGAMQLLTNLVPDPSTDMVWVPRPASIVQTSFGTFTTPGFISALIVVGDIAYGMIASGAVAAHDQPFAFNLSTSAFETVSGANSGNVPTSPATTGDWTPPIMFVAAQRIIVTHPGFSGANKFGWFDISGYSSNTITGTTHTNTTVDTLSGNPITAGWQVGMTITGTDIPANTVIVSLTAAAIVISNAATGGHGSITFTVAGGTATAPLWGAGDTNANNLPSVPVGGYQMNGRAYFACGVNGIPFTDALNPTQRTNASQALTTNDGLAVTAIGGLGAAQTAGGSPIVTALVVFEGVAKMQLITGDSATTNLQMNTLPVATGTLAPLSLIVFKLGLGFVSPEGLRYVDGFGVVSDPIGDHGTGVTQPFINAAHPSRISACANADTIRISVENTAGPGGATFQEWDFDLGRKVWHGPHSFPFDQCELWKNSFVIAATGITAKLFKSDIVPNTSSTYTENGTVLSWTWQSCLLPDSAQMGMTAIVRTTTMDAIGATAMTVVATDEANSPLSTVVITGMDVPTLWDVAVWDVGSWDGTSAVFREHLVPWHTTVLWKQGTVQKTSVSVIDQHIGGIQLRYQQLGYDIQVAA